MTPIEHAAKEIVSQMWPHVNLDNPGMERFIEMTKDHITALTKPLEDENKRLQKALEGADELNLANQQLADEVKRLKEHIVETARLLRNAADNVRQSEIENKRLREALGGIKLHCLTSRDRADRILIHIVRLCRDAGVVEDYTELARTN